MFTVYILYSDLHEKHYTGFTADLSDRFAEHNERAKSGWTVKYRPWRIIHSETYATKREAIMREKWFKTGVGRDFLRNLPH